MSNWTAAEILLTAAVLALAMPREDGFVIPDRRDWLGWLRRLRPGFRRLREEEAGREADRYVTDLRADPDQGPMTIRADQLPSTQRVYRGPLVSPPSALKPPWRTAENPAWAAPAQSQEPPGERPRRRAPGDPPTIVIEIMRPAVESDLGRYLAELPAYADDESGDEFFVPRSSLSLGTPDHDGPPGDVGDDKAEEDHLTPLQGQVEHAEVDPDEGREQGPGDGQLQQDGVPPPP